MFRKLRQLQRNNKIYYGILAVFVVILFFTGQRVGSLISEMLNDTPDLLGNIPLTETQSSGAAIVNPPKQLSNFTLTSQTGEALSLQDLRGQTVLMFFGYTNCPDVCPTTLHDFKTAKDALGDEADDVEFVFISVDSSRDTPAVLADYLATYDSEFIGMTGSDEQLQQLGSEYGLVFDATTINVDHEHPETAEHDINADDSYFMSHTSPSFLVDENGYLRLVFFYGANTDVMVQGIREIMQNPIQ